MDEAFCKWRAKTFGPIAASVYIAAQEIIGECLATFFANPPRGQGRGGRGGEFEILTTKMRPFTDRAGAAIRLHSADPTAPVGKAGEGAPGFRSAAGAARMDSGKFAGANH